MIKIPKNIEYILKTLIFNGYEAYIVGGCVRDSLLGKTPEDYDITTSATPDEIISIFEKTVPTGIKHGTVTVIINDASIEVTTFRCDGEYKDSRHPEKIEFVKNLKTDLSRRDFTINAMAYNASTGLIDCFGGLEDLKNGILRTVGNPEKRFGEDALRILRLFRFASTLNFKIEQTTLNAALTLSHCLENISAERIATELQKAIKGEQIEIFAELINGKALSFLDFKHCPDFEIIKKCQQNKTLAFFSFFYLSGCDTNKICSVLKLSNKYKTYFLSLLSLIKMPIPKSKAEIKQRLCLCNEKTFNDYLLFINSLGNKTDELYKLKSEILENNEPYLISQLAINGDDLKALGFKGKKIGENLNILKNHIIANPLCNNKSDLLQIVKNL